MFYPVYTVLFSDAQGKIPQYFGQRPQPIAPELQQVKEP